MYGPNLKSILLPVPDIIAIAVLGGGCEHTIYEKEGVGGREWYRSKER